MDKSRCAWILVASEPLAKDPYLHPFIRIPSMLRAIVLSLAFFFVSSAITAQNLNHLDSLDFQALHNSEVSDIWGYEDENGNEYAIVGVNDTGVSIVDVTDPNNPVEVYYSEEQASTTWRDIKTVNDHAYIVNEGGGGLKIIDLGPLPGSTNLSETTYTAGGMFTTAHNIYIDSDSVAYILGSDHGVGGAIMLDLSNDPMNPSVIGIYDQEYIHDGMVRNDTLYACQINVGNFAIIDVSNPSNPQVVATHSTPSNFTHNAWVSDDGDHLYTTDEVSDGYIASYDISDPSNIQELDRIQVEPGSGSIPHNTHFKNEYLITSYYRDGVVIHDVKNPGNMVEVGRYDVAPGMSGNGFNGAWGVYPWLSSENLIATDIEDGLHILGPDYKRGCYLEGTITEQSSGNPISGAIARFEPSGPRSQSDITGDYDNGIGTPGTYDVVYQEPTYFPDTAFNVPMSRDSLTIRDIQLQKRPQYTVRFEFQDVSDGTPIENAKLVLNRRSQNFNGPNYSGTTNSNGAVEISGIYQGSYELHGGDWGHKPYCDDSVHLDGPDTILIELDPGYSDDFAVDLGWSSINNSNTGHWERGEPKGTSVNFGGSTFPINPDEDVSGDCGEQAYVTGNQGSSPTDDQVDTLTNTLMTPKMDLASYNAPLLQYSAWFVSGAQGGGLGDDTMYVSMHGGGLHVTLDTLTAGFLFDWEQRQVDLQPYAPFNDSMKIHFAAGDPNGNTITEAGVDRFRILDQPQSIRDQTASKEGIRVMPIPFEESFKLRWEDERQVRLELYDMQGRLLKERSANGVSARMQGGSLEEGVYFLRVKDAKSGELLGRESVVKAPH